MKTQQRVKKIECEQVFKGEMNLLDQDEFTENVTKWIIAINKDIRNRLLDELIDEIKLMTFRSDKPYDIYHVTELLESKRQEVN